VEMPVLDEELKPSIRTPDVWIVGVGTTGAQLVASYIHHEKEHTPIYSLKKFKILVLDTIAETRLKEQLKEGTLSSDIIYPLARHGSGRNVKIAHEIFTSQVDAIKDRLGLLEQSLGAQYIIFTSLAGGTGAGGTPLVTKWILESNPDNTVVVFAVWPEENPPNNFVNACWSLAQLIKIRNQYRTKSGTSRMLIVLISNQKLLELTGQNGGPLAKEGILYIPDYLVTEAALKRFAILNRYIVEITKLFLATIYPNMEVVADLMPCQQELSNYLTYLGDRILVPSKISIPSTAMSEKTLEEVLSMIFRFVGIRTSPLDKLLNQDVKLMSHFALIMAEENGSLEKAFSFLEKASQTGYLTTPFVSVPVVINLKKGENRTQILVMGALGDYSEIRSGLKKAIDILVTFGEDIILGEGDKEMMKSGIVLEELQEAVDILIHELNIAERQCGKRIPIEGIEYEFWKGYIVDRLIDNLVIPAIEAFKAMPIYRFRPVPRDKLVDTISMKLDSEFRLEADAPPVIRKNFSKEAGVSTNAMAILQAVSALWYGVVTPMNSRERLESHEFRRAISSSRIIKDGNIRDDLYERITDEDKKALANIILDMAVIARPSLKTKVSD